VFLYFCRQDTFGSEMQTDDFQYDGGDMSTGFAYPRNSSFSFSFSSLFSCSLHSFFLFWGWEWGRVNLFYTVLSMA